MRREIKLIILVFALVVGPAIALSFLAARVLESWQIVLQKRLAGEAARVLDDAAAVWSRELESCGVLPDTLGVYTKPTGPWVAHVAGLKQQHIWLEGCYYFQSGPRLLYPAPEPLLVKFNRNESGREMDALLNASGIYLRKGDTNAAIECLEKVGGIGGDEGRLQNSGSGIQNIDSGAEKVFAGGRRDPEEGFFYDLVALKRLAEIAEGQGQSARVAEIRKMVLGRVLSRYDELVPLQRESMVQWLAGGAKAGARSVDGRALDRGPGAGLAARWCERMWARRLDQEARDSLVSGIRLAEAALPDTGWIKIRLKQDNFLVARIPSPNGDPPLVCAMQYSEGELRRHLDALFLSLAGSTELRVRCEAGDGFSPSPILATRSLPAPLEGITLMAVPADVPAFMANARLQTWLYRGGGLLLLISVVAGGWLIWREAAGEIRLARERSDFAAAVSHDLRTPLSSMRMLAESLYMGRVSEEAKQKKFLGAIVKESDRLSRLTDRALYFIRYGQGALRYHFTEGDLGGVVREAVRANGEWLQAGGIEQNGIRITVDIAPDLPPVKFDAGAMEQVVYNLLDNALKYSCSERRAGSTEGRGEEGGERGAVIRVKLYSNEAGIVLSVQDRGAGMTPEEVCQILKPYVRGKQAGRQNASGVGLGLALCQHIVQAHGGRIQIQSEPGQGSTFYVILPG